MDKDSLKADSMNEDSMKEDPMKAEDLETDLDSAAKQDDDVLDEDVLEGEILDGIHEDNESDTPQDAEKKLNNEYLSKLQRTLADFDNFRKRTAKEKASMYNDGVRDTIEKLLPSIDNFERALASTPNKNDSFYKGVEMIYRQIMVALDDLGVQVIAATGETFDPNVHHAVAHVEDPAYGENEVMEELQRGYMYKDKVIRPTMVRVAN